MKKKKVKLNSQNEVATLQAVWNSESCSLGYYMTKAYSVQSTSHSWFNGTFSKIGFFRGTHTRMEADILNHYLLCLLLVLFLLGTVILLKDVLWPPSVLL